LPEDTVQCEGRCTLQKNKKFGDKLKTDMTQLTEDRHDTIN